MLNSFEIKNITGLSEQEVKRRQEQEGFNELQSANKRSFLTIAFEVAREPMFLLLIASGIIYLLLGDKEEALMLLSFVFVIIGITIYQERKTEHALEALRDLSSPRALVIRDREQKRIAGREVVRGDIIILAEGDRVPADAVLLWCVNLSADESLLTGESVPVRKMTGDGKEEKMERPGGDDLPYVFSGTLITQGQGVARVLSIAMNTEMGRIGRALQTLDADKTLLQRDIKKLVMNLALIGLSLCIIVVVIYGVTRGNWLNGFLAGITLAMATLPEEFPVVLTIFLALGAWRMSQKKVLTRRMPAIESLGSATVLCVDKTGTLTVNRMTVKKLFSRDRFYDLRTNVDEALPESFHELAEYSILASQKDPFDPMEKAFMQIGHQYLMDTEHLHDEWALVYEYPLSREMLALSHVWKSTHTQDYIIAAKGAPEAIAELCHFSDRQMKDLMEKIQIMAGDGLRILGVAKACFKHSDLPDEQHDFDFEFLGLAGLEAPIRPTVPAAIKECYEAGIRVIMITGDYPGTAQNIGRQIGLKSIDDMITGPELNAMKDEELKEHIRTVNIFARVVPEQKLRIVQALKAVKEVVAMTGDGVNDAPALKAADIGIAMGGRGTDVARESSALVILDDDFSSIVQAVRMGRRIFDNIKKAMAYILGIHVPIAGMSLIPVLFKMPLVLLPVHIVFLELIIDPVCSVVFEAEPEEKDVMKRMPRDPREPLFSRQTIGLSLLQGFSVLQIVLGVYFISLLRGQGELEARALTFTTLIIANLGLIMINRSWSQLFVSTLNMKNKAMTWIMAGTLFFLGLVLYVPLLRELFRFAVLHPVDIIICIGAGIVSILWFEFFKVWKRKRT
ncbi:MAG: cation-translocating P-type ATPase [bacterium]|nr:cation-translocating P-type ATPase [bacterium]